MQFSTVRVNFSQLREEVLEGRTYLVAPVVAIVAGVLNGLLVSVDEIAAAGSGWDGIPLVLRHPKNESGSYISANTPPVLERHGIGRLFNTRLDGDRLKGEAWLDVAKLESMGSAGARLLERVRAGEPVEVSTGYLAAIEPRAGQLNGRDYKGVTRGIIPDHLALLPDVEGACNWQDGCGLPRVNEAQEERPCQCGKHVAANKWETSVMVAFFLPLDDAQELAQPDLPSALPPAELHITLAYMGNIGDEGLTSRMDVEAAVREFAHKHPPLTLRLTGNVGRFQTVESDETNAVYLEVDTADWPGEELLLFRERLARHLEAAGFPVSRQHDPYTPHITIAYIPVADETPVLDLDGRWIELSKLTFAWGGDRTAVELTYPGRAYSPPPQPEEVRMDASEKRVNLTEQPELPEVETEDTPAVEAPEAVTANEEDAAVDVTDTAVESQEEVEETPETPEAEQEDEDEDEEPVPGLSLASIRDEVGRALQDALAPFMPVLAALQANHQRQVEDVRQRILSNARNTFTAEELAGFDLPKLEKLAGMLDVPVVNYAGRGTQANAGRKEDVDGPLKMPDVLKAK